jgi:hydrogenase expression/formation protein HypC
MCIAVSGELIEKDGSRGRVSVRGNVIPVELGLVEAKIGDSLLIHAGCAISILDKSESDELNELLTLLDETK